MQSDPASFKIIVTAHWSIFWTSVYHQFMYPKQKMHS